MSELGTLYARALYEIAQEAGVEQEILRELQEVCAQLEAEPQYLRLMDSHTIPRRERAQMLDAAFAKGLRAETLSTLKLLMERNAFGSVPDCAAAYRALYNAHHGIAEAKIVSAVEMDEDQKARLIGALEARTEKKITPCFVVDQSLRGGVRIELNGVCYDNSIATQLERMSRMLSSPA